MATRKTTSSSKTVAAAALLGCALALAMATPASAKGPARGRWGEDPAVVPDFALPQERRAPKIPAGDVLYRRYAGARTLDRVDGALLVCSIEVRPSGRRPGALRALADAFSFGAASAPDLTVSLRLRDEPAMVLWGPQSHWSSFVSFPAVSLARGDRMAASMLDRNIGRDEALGSATITWDGQVPLSMASRRWSMSCAILTSDEARREAAPWMASLDRQLDEVERTPLSRERRDFGYPAHRIEQLKGMFKELFTKEGNFRYAAGFVGWGDPDLQTRLARLRSLEGGWRTRLTMEVETIATGLPPPGTDVAVGDAPFALKAEGLTCAGRRRGVSRDRPCTARVALVWTDRDGAPDAGTVERRDCDVVRRVLAELADTISDGGEPLATRLELVSADGRPTCRAGATEAATRPMRALFAVPPSTRLLAVKRTFVRLR